MKADDVTSLAEAGYLVNQLNHGQFRVNHLVDIFPKSRKFHVIDGLEKGKRGVYEEGTAIALIERLQRQGRPY